jgi:plastocyanin
MRWKLCAALTLLALPFLSACTGESNQPAETVSAIDWSDGSRIVQRSPKSPRQQAEEAGGALEVRVSDAGFQPSQVRAAYGSRVKIYLLNTGIREHNIVIPRFGIVTQPLVQGGDTYIEFTASEKGRWPFFSDGPGAHERGLDGVLIVE